MTLADLTLPARRAERAVSLSDLLAGLTAVVLLAGGLALAASAPERTVTGADLDWHGNSATLIRR
ncbi:hypothetical protein [Roseivivax isoporae]|uniref:Uncharacterized protein n=1 Tax=Roseivivax isoporae LMG 25204 TaxID=1449351 RepID=X7F5F5_9RHOB|nr:hypothetical protein [Roseivivax isoporae]ETX27336.1 hypothetical protein RISW2_14640 [Roseivivax isoporae LMG 25204]